MQKIKRFVKTTVQRVFITAQMFTQNSLANHAAAGAYGFLLSAAPALLLVAFFFLTVFRSPPRAILEFVLENDFLTSVVDSGELTTAFLSVSSSGISGIISVISIIWAGRVFSISLNRGLKVIFSGTEKRNPITENLIVIGLELAVVGFAVMALLSYRVSKIFSVGILTAAIYSSYRLVPVEPPRRLSALIATVLCIFLTVSVSTLMSAFLGQTRYNFVYGALAGLILLLVDVYFFFMFYYMSAQFAFVRDYFEPLLFSRMRGTTDSKNRAEKQLFSIADGKLRKYAHSYEKGETIFHKGDTEHDVYYIISGDVSVHINEEAFVVLHKSSFFGEMCYLLHEPRVATVKALTDVSVLILPPALFDKVLETDTNISRMVIENLAIRLRQTDEKLIHGISLP